MIKKQLRLKENEVKKVLQKGKPFFSYGLVLNKFINRLWHDRFAIVISWKSVVNNISRNFFRRLFYNEISKSYLLNDVFKNPSYDMVFVVKIKNKLDRKSSEILKSFLKDIRFLLSKI